MSSQKSKIILIILFFIFIVIGLLFTIIFISDARLTGKGYLRLYEYNKTYYLGYPISWEGVINPRIENAYLLNENKQIIHNEKTGSYSIEFLVEESENLGIISEDDLNHYNFDLLQLQNYKVNNKDVNLVIKVKLFDDYLKNVEYLRIDYKILGIRKTEIFGIKLIE